MKYSKTIATMALVSTLAMPLANTGTAFAATTDLQTNSVAKASTILTQEQIKQLDPYVSVKDNKYLLNLPNNTIFSQTEVEAAQQMIDEANISIKNTHSIINPVTKIGEPQRLSVLASKYHYTYKNFYWGTRYYFRSNHAVYEMENELSNYSTTLAIAGALGGLASSGVASAIGAIGSAYFNKVRSDLDYMNNTHPHNYLYMDVNFTGIYTIAVL